MAILVIGPSCSGKSTLIAQRAKFNIPGDNIKFGFMLLNEEFSDHDIIHYNLLHAATGDPCLPPDEASFLDEAIFNKIVHSGRIESCCVIVASKADLIRRAQTRTAIEPDVSGDYPREFWRHLLERLNLPAIYESLFDRLASLGIPSRVFVSVESDPPVFLPSDRVHVHANLRGVYIQPPSHDVLQAVRDDPDGHYQTVDLPGEQRTSSVSYPHLEGRSDLRRLLPQGCAGQSMLDIGCAQGQLLFSAERLGAGRLLGGDVNEGRVRMARKLASILESRAAFIIADFNRMTIGERFDHVFALNVIHHVTDFREFLKRACLLAERSLTVEFPTLGDPVFGQTVSLDEETRRRLDDIPAIGVSTGKVDQSYVFSPAALERIVIGEIGVFSVVERLTPTIANRAALRFSHPTAR